MKDNERILVSLLARSDALLRPWRDVGDECYAVVCDRRDFFPSRGVPMRTGGNETDRKRGERTIRELVAAKRIQTFRSNAGKQKSARLTEAADIETRKLCGLPDIYQSLMLAQDIAEHEQTIGTINGMIPEILLAGVQWGVADTRPFGGVELDALPGLARGWFVYRVTPQRHCWWSLTKEGRKAIKGFDRRKAEAMPEDKGRNECWLFYSMEYVAARAELHGLKSEGGSIGDMPLPVCGFRGDYWKKCQEFLKSLDTGEVKP